MPEFCPIIILHHHHQHVTGNFCNVSHTTSPCLNPQPTPAYTSGSSWFISDTIVFVPQTYSCVSSLGFSQPSRFFGDSFSRRLSSNLINSQHVSRRHYPLRDGLQPRHPCSRSSLRVRTVRPSSATSMRRTPRFERRSLGPLVVSSSSSQFDTPLPSSSSVHHRSPISLRCALWCPYIQTRHSCFALTPTAPARRRSQPSNERLRTSLPKALGHLRATTCPMLHLMRISSGGEGMRRVLLIQNDTEQMC